MAVLEQITQMKGDGMSTSQIIQSLKEQGISPKEINEALSQSEIKNEVNRTQEYNNESYGMQENSPPQGYPYDSSYEQENSPYGPDNNSYRQEESFSANLLSTQPQSSPRNNHQQYPDQEYFQQNTPQNSMNQVQQSQSQVRPPVKNNQEMMPSIERGAESSSQSQLPREQSPPQESYPEYPEYAPQEYYEDYSQYPEYVPPQSTDLETINDIVTQIIDEKLHELKKEVPEIMGFSKKIEERMMFIEDKLEKLQNNLNELQMSIIRKVGEYGENIEDISKELRATQNSFSKILNPLTDNIREMQKVSGSGINAGSINTEDSQRKSPQKKSPPDFEDYLRE